MKFILGILERRWGKGMANKEFFFFFFYLQTSSILNGDSSTTGS